MPNKFMSGPQKFFCSPNAVGYVPAINKITVKHKVVKIPDTQQT